MKKVIVIVGPTGSGKTALSIALAKYFQAEIINGDSVQVYQGLDIGSAKITKDEMQGIKHHLIDHKHPHESYSVFDFQQDVRTLINDINIPMIVGGTGLYIKAALYDYRFKSKGRSEDFENQFKDVPTEQLYKDLKQKDPHTKIDQNNRRRIIRALEMLRSGHIPSTLNQKDQPLYDLCMLYLDLDKETLHRRIEQRLETMLEKGFQDEVQKLRSMGIKHQAIGYKEMNLYLDGMMDYQTMKQSIIQATKKLAKRQKTWFKNQENPHILNAQSDDVLKDAIKIIKAFLEA